jgi:hypothetical protein
MHFPHFKENGPVCKFSHTLLNDLSTGFHYKKDNFACARYYHVISGSLSKGHGASAACGWKNGHQYGGKLRIYWISSRGQPTRGRPPTWVLGEVLTCTEASHKASHSDGLTIWYDLSYGKGHEIQHVGAGLWCGSLMEGGHSTWKTSGRIILKLIIRSKIRPGGGGFMD